MVALGWRREQANGNGRARRRGGRDERPLCQTGSLIHPPSPWTVEAPLRRVSKRLSNTLTPIEMININHRRK
eukprot:scaffold4049_cov204-Alexandrium_tamarense.AAC.72